MKKLAVILLALILLGCTSHKAEVKLNATVSAVNITPNFVMGMHKIVCLTGEEALKFVKMMHVGKIRFVEDIAMMHYLNLTNPHSKFVTVWVTLYPNSSVAKEETERMAKSMIDYGWKNVKSEDIDGLKVYYVTPPDKNETHYFWCKGSYMIYIIPHNMTSEEIKEFIIKISK